MFHAHVDYDDLAALGNGAPIEGSGRVTGLIMAGHKCDRLVDVSVGHGNARIGQSADTGRYAGNYADGHPMLHQSLRFLTTAAKDEGIAPFEPQHAFARTGQLHQIQ